MKRSQKDLDKDLNRLHYALESVRTMDYLTKKFDTDRYTMYKWIRALERRGVKIMRVGIERPTRYVALP